jgi:hypothetical protein
MPKPNECELVGALQLALDAYEMAASNHPVTDFAAQTLAESAYTIRDAWLEAQPPSVPASPSSEPSVVEAMLAEAKAAGWELETDQQN